MAAKVIRADEIVARRLRTVAPVLASYFTEEMVVRMLQEGEKLACIIKQKEDEMMQKAKEHVEQKKVNLQQEIEAMKYEGYQAGLEEGKKEFQNRVKELLFELEQVKSKTGQATETFLQDVECQIVRFALAVAEKITRVTFQNKEEALINYIKGLFDQISIKDSITIKVNPKQFERILKHKEELSHYLGEEDITIQKDSHIDDCGVGISMDTGFMDAGIKSIFSQLEKKILNE